MSTHTPGPWVVRKDSSIETKDGLTVAGFIDDVKDAALIAAAPELLEALKGVVAALSQPKTFPADIEAAKAFAIRAITKAEGRG